MPPKTVFKKENIVDAAYELVEEIGIKEFSTRKVAEKLKCSQIPIYSHFKSVEELLYEVELKAKNVLLEYTKKRYTKGIFLNIGVGVVVFSREHRRLFEALSTNKQLMEELMVTLHEHMKEDILLKRVGFTEEELLNMLEKMFIYTYGLADIISKGLIKPFSDEQIIKSLNEVGDAVIFTMAGDRINNNK